MYQVQISYNWRDGKERECQEFLANKLAPGLAQLGFQFQDVQYTMWGNSPQIVGNGLVDTLSKAQEIFHSSASVDPNLAFLAIFSRDCRDFGVIYSDFGYRKQPISYLKIAQI
ncbi:hypothetical protein KFU94_19920 [Chloroflexi bacterium TSY]|nr:hypothetical protein [Chloroflexi bacterium TSY]